MCVWQSMIPGMMCFPLASITFAPAGVNTWAPTSVIKPFCMTTEPFSVPFVTV